MQYALVSSTCKTTGRNMTLAVERDVKQQINKQISQRDRDQLRFLLEGVCHMIIYLYC